MFQQSTCFLMFTTMEDPLRDRKSSWIDMRQPVRTEPAGRYTTSYRVALRAAPAPFPRGSYQLADHRLRERKSQNKQVKGRYTIYFRAKAEILKQLHADTSRRIDYRLHRDRTGRGSRKTLILLYCLCGGTSPTLVNKRPRGRKTQTARALRHAAKQRQLY